MPQLEWGLSADWVLLLRWLGLGEPGKVPQLLWGLPADGEPGKVSQLVWGLSGWVEQPLLGLCEPGKVPELVCCLSLVLWLDLLGPGEPGKVSQLVWGLSAEPHLLGPGRGRCLNWSADWVLWLDLLEGYCQSTCLDLLSRGRCLNCYGACVLIECCG